MAETNIETAVNKIKQNVANTYAVLYGMGADAPVEETSDNLAQTAGTTKVIRYNEQALTEDQKSQARTNIGAASASEVSRLSSAIVDYQNHKTNTSIHVSTAEKQVWNGKADKTDIPTITQEAGESESLVMSQKAVTDLVHDAISSGGSSGNTEYETVDSVEEMTDTSKQYVLSSTNTVWTYGEVDLGYKELYDPTAIILGKRHSGTPPTLKAASTYFMTNEIPVDMSVSDPRLILTGKIRAVGETNADFPAGFQKVGMYNASGVCLAANYIGFTDATHLKSERNGEKITVHIGVLNDGSKVDGYADISYVLIEVVPSTSAATAEDASILKSIVNPDVKNIVSKWYDTGLTPSSDGVGNGNYVDLLVKVNQNKTNIAEVSNRVTALETGSDSIAIPTFWKDAVNTCIAKIKALQVGRNCITFPFFSDNHQRNGYSGMLIAHVMKECYIPYCFYGGDSISSAYIADEATMIAQDKAFDTAMSYIPNGRFCRAVGNHDGYWAVDENNKNYYTDAQNYELFLREESIAQNKHFGGDGTYYYVDDVASKVRWIIMDTNDNTVEAEQIAWMQNTALKFDENGWAVVFISHQPISNHYHAQISNAADVRNAIANYINGTDANKAVVVGWYSGHIHRDRIYSGAAVNTSDDSEGTAMPFKQITITSDHTGIAYDNATKHTVANDDQSHAIDFVTINKATRTVNLTRLGIGEDRSYTY